MVLYMNMKQLGKRRNTVDQVPFTYAAAPGSLRELIAESYVDGLRFVGAKDMEQVLQVGDIRITKKGRNFLRDESVVSKIKPVLGTGFEALVTAVASVVMP